MQRPSKHECRQRSKEVQRPTRGRLQVGQQEDMQDLTKKTEKKGQKSERRKAGQK